MSPSLFSIPTSWSNLSSSVFIVIFKTALWVANFVGRQRSNLFTSFFSLYLFSKYKCFMCHRAELGTKAFHIINIKPLEISNWNPRWSRCVLMTLSSPSNKFRRISIASLPEVLSWISWNYSASNAPKIADRAFALNFDVFRSTYVQSSFGLGFFPSFVTMVGSSHPISAAVHVSSLIPRINCFMRAFQCPYWSTSNMIAFCIETIVSIFTYRITPVTLMPRSETNCKCKDNTTIVLQKITRETKQLQANTYALLEIFFKQSITRPCLFSFTCLVLTP